MSPIHSFTYPDSVGLCEGDVNPAVELLQTFLQRFGYLCIPEMTEEFPAIRAASPIPEAKLGSFDGATTTALRHFQEFHHLEVTGVLDEETITVMSRPRCGFPDIPSTEGISNFVAQGNQWQQSDLTYAYQNFSPQLTESDTRDAMFIAFELWSEVTRLTFTEVEINSNPDIVISFVTGEHGDGSPFDGIGNVLAHAFYPPPNGGDIAGDVHFDEAEPWTVNIPVPDGKIDLVTVASHEIGHSLGLAHSSVVDALMFPSYSGPHRFLAQDDIDGIRSIYGVEESAGPA